MMRTSCVMSVISVQLNSFAKNVISYYVNLVIRNSIAKEHESFTAAHLSTLLLTVMPKPIIRNRLTILKVFTNSTLRSVLIVKLAPPQLSLDTSHVLLFNSLESNSEHATTPQSNSQWGYRYRPKVTEHLAPKYQPASDFRIVMVNKRTNEPSTIGLIMKALYELAVDGIIILESKDLEVQLTENPLQHITQIEFAKGVKGAEEKNLIIITKRQIISNPEKEYISINLPVVSLESVIWILKSLERDEMTPTERSVQSRFKESFGIKINAQEWEKTMKAIRNPKLILRAPSDPRYEFDVISINDPVSGCEIFAIYPKGKRWASLDISLKASDINQELFREFLSFMESYLSDPQLKGYNERAIPGGRYGCAQFVKASGTMRLKRCSLGQLSQFIQFAINEDILRYKKTLLVWNKNPAKFKNNEITFDDSEASRQKKVRIRNKLNIVKRTIIDILTENSLGLSLAQLPLHLKYRLSFPLDLNELGFVKLKDLLNTMSDQIKVELRGHNHPFAILMPNKPKKELAKTHTEKPKKTYSIPEQRTAYEQSVYIKPEQYAFPTVAQNSFIDFNKRLESIRNFVYQVLQDLPAGIDSMKLGMMLFTQLGVTQDWSLFGCNSFLDLLQKYVATHVPLDFIPLNPYDNTQFIVRRKDVYMNYAVTNYYNQQYVAEPYTSYPFYPTDKQRYVAQPRYGIFPSVHGNEPYSKELVSVWVILGFLLNESCS